MCITILDCCIKSGISPIPIWFKFKKYGISSTWYTKTSQVSTQFFNLSWLVIWTIIDCNNIEDTLSLCNEKFDFYLPSYRIHVITLRTILDWLGRHLVEIWIECGFLSKKSTFWAIFLNSVHKFAQNWNRMRPKKSFWKIECAYCNDADTVHPMLEAIWIVMAFFLL